MTHEDPCQRNSTLIMAYTAKKAISDGAANLIEAHCTNKEMTGKVCDECAQAIAYCSEEVIFADFAIDALLRGEDIVNVHESFIDLGLKEAAASFRGGDGTEPEARPQGIVVAFPVQPGKTPF